MYHINYNRPAKDVVLDLIYENNQIRILNRGLTLGKPQKLDQRPDLQWDGDTYIAIKTDPLIDARFAGTDGLLYQRVSLGDVPLSDDPFAQLPVPTYPFKTSDILDQINAFFGVQLAADDIIDTTYDSVDGGLTITFSPDCLVFEGTYMLADTMYGFFFPTLELNGFVEHAG